LSKDTTGTARSIKYGEWRRYALLKNRSGAFFRKLISHISDCICHISEDHNGKESRFIPVTFEGNDAYGSKTQDDRQQSLKTGTENTQNKPHNYEQNQTYSAGKNTTKISIHKGEYI
jgi:hypothetical protein